MSAYKAGESRVSIANRMNVSTYTVHYHINKAGLTRKPQVPRRKRLSQEMSSAICTMHDMGLSIAEIARKLKLPNGTVYNKVNRYIAKREAPPAWVMHFQQPPAPQPSLWQRVKSWFA